jgi:uncharacterized HAD superfamily protein
MKDTKVIGIDFDDVVVQTNKAMAMWHNRVYGTEYEREDISSYNLTSLWGCSQEEMLRRIHEFFLSPEHEATIPLDEVAESLEVLKNRELHVITARDEEFKIATLLLAERHVPFLLDKFNFPNTTTKKRTKSQVCLELGIEVFIDDHLDYARDVAASGIPVLLFDCPWNQTDDLPHNVTRVHSWKEILQKLV